MALKVLIVSSEAVPFAKTGGLADVAGSLPKALMAAGCGVAIAMPLYREVIKRGGDFEEVVGEIIVRVGLHDVRASLLRGENDGVPVYFLKQDEYFDRGALYGTPDGDYFDNLERFTLFSRGLLEGLSRLGTRFDVIHCNDWQTGLIPVYLKSLYSTDKSFAKTATLFTIHNIAYQGVFPSPLFPVTGLPSRLFAVDGLEFWGNISLLKAGVLFSELVTTVSKRYSREIQTNEFGYGLEGVLKARSKQLFGVLNGVDYEQWNPESDPYIAAHYSRRSLAGKGICRKDLLDAFGLKLPPKSPLLGVISRLADQKGFDILSEAMDEIMAMDVGMVVLGTGERRYHDLFTTLAGRYPKRLGVKITYDNTLAHKIEAGADIFLMPSKYEPCGLNQIYSLKYGTVPVVRATGGLDDTVEGYDRKSGEGNGFKFSRYSPRALVKKVGEAVDLFRERKEWRKVMQNGMAEDFSWERSAQRYITLYRRAVKMR
ncbi:MAG: glycogen synthase GlgA, partial [Thermodesulfobacteriota bacterium]